jgi:hypothetical protein
MKPALGSELPQTPFEVLLASYLQLVALRSERRQPLSRATP